MVSKTTQKARAQTKVFNDLAVLERTLTGISLAPWEKELMQKQIDDARESFHDFLDISREEERDIGKKILEQHKQEIQELKQEAS